MLPLSIAIVLTVLDQLTKVIVCRSFLLYEAVPVIPGLFNLRYIQNTGAAWGMFAGGHYWLSGLSLVVLAGLVMFQRHFFNRTLLDQCAFGIMMGGIIGNLIDRVRLSYVVDFLDFHWNDAHFPAFNVADAAICSGVALYMLSQGLQARRQRRISAAAASGGPAS
ncbi:MAG TPA: signal peptidase II [Verrucomicrobia bacterium]|nr:signal peptidase II [Verrucomicrobiota bacterium]